MVAANAIKDGFADVADIAAVAKLLLSKAQEPKRLNVKRSLRPPDGGVPGGGMAAEMMPGAVAFTIERSIPDGDDDPEAACQEVGIRERFVVHPKAKASVVRIGRAHGSEIMVDIVGVSTVHAEIFLDRGIGADGSSPLCVRDVSVNGTGLRLPSGKKSMLKKDVDCILPDGGQLLLPLRAQKGPNGEKTKNRRCMLTVRMEPPLPNGHLWEKTQSSSSSSSARSVSPITPTCAEKEAAAAAAKFRDAASPNDVKESAMPKAVQNLHQQKQQLSTQSLRRSISSAEGLLPEIDHRLRLPPKRPAISAGAIPVTAEEMRRRLAEHRAAAEAIDQQVPSSRGKQVAPAMIAEEPPPPDTDSQATIGYLPAPPAPSQLLSEVLEFMDPIPIPVPVQVLRSRSASLAEQGVPVVPLSREASKSTQRKERNRSKSRKKRRRGKHKSKSRDRGTRKESRSRSGGGRRSRSGGRRRRRRLNSPTPEAAPAPAGPGVSVDEYGGGQTWSNQQPMGGWGGMWQNPWALQGRVQAASGAVGQALPPGYQHSMMPGYQQQLQRIPTHQPPQPPHPQGERLQSPAHSQGERLQSPAHAPQRPMSEPRSQSELPAPPPSQGVVGVGAALPLPPPPPQAQQGEGAIHVPSARSKAESLGISMAPSALPVASSTTTSAHVLQRPPLPPPPGRGISSANAVPLGVRGDPGSGSISNNIPPGGVPPPPPQPVQLQPPPLPPQPPHILPAHMQPPQMQPPETIAPQHPPAQAAQPKVRPDEEFMDGIMDEL